MTPKPQQQQRKQAHEEPPAAWEAYSAQDVDRGILEDEQAQVALMRHLWRILGRHEHVDVAIARVDVVQPYDGPMPCPEIRLHSELVKHDVPGESFLALVSKTGAGRRSLGRQVLRVLRRHAQGVSAVVLDFRIRRGRYVEHVVALLDPAGQGTVPDRGPNGELRLRRELGVEWSVYAGFKPLTVLQEVRDHVACQGTPPRRHFTAADTTSGWDPEMDLGQAARFALSRYYGSDHVLASAVPSGDLLDEEAWLMHGYHCLDAQAMAASMAAIWDNSEGRIREDFDPRDIPRSPDAYVLANEFYEARYEDAVFAV